jgi:hypothetical protein
MAGIATHATPRRFLDLDQSETRNFGTNGASTSSMEAF